jgi:hypothetical protein
MCKYRSNQYPECDHLCYERKELCVAALTFDLGWNCCETRWSIKNDQGLPAPGGALKCPKCIGIGITNLNVCMPRMTDSPRESPFRDDGYWESKIYEKWFSAGDQGKNEMFSQGFFQYPNAPDQRTPRQPPEFRGKALEGIPRRRDER